MTASERSLPPLTKRQREVLDCIEAHLLLDGVVPTLLEVGMSLKVSRTTIYEHIRHLIEKGWLEHAGERHGRATVRPVRTVEAMLRERIAELEAGK